MLEALKKPNGLTYTGFYTNNYQKLLKGILSVFLLLILIFFAGGILKISFYLNDLFYEDIEVVAKAFLIRTLLLLSLLEIIGIILAYFQEGRVRVLFLIDTVFIIISAEVVSFWFKNGPTIEILFLSSILFTLVIVRIFTIKFSLKCSECRKEGGDK